jgi:transcription initiation factor IIE alpha subunit
MTSHVAGLKPDPKMLDRVPIKYVMKDQLHFTCSECGSLSRLEEAINPDYVDKVDIHCPHCEESLEYSSPFKELVGVTGTEVAEEVCEWNR